MISKYKIKKQYPNAKFGSSRAFIAFDGYGCKIPHNEKGLAECEQESQVLSEYYVQRCYQHILPKLVDKDCLEGGYCVELLKKVDGKTFREITGLGIREACEAFRKHSLYMKFGFESAGEKFWENEWWYDVVTFMGDYGFTCGDLRPANLMTDGENIKIVDFIHNI